MEGNGAILSSHALEDRGSLHRFLLNQDASGFTQHPGDSESWVSVGSLFCC